MVAYLGAGYYNIVDDQLAQLGEMEDTLVVRRLSGDIRKPAGAVYHIEVGQGATLKLPKVPRNLSGL